MSILLLSKATGSGAMSGSAVPTGLIEKSDLRGAFHLVASLNHTLGSAMQGHAVFLSRHFLLEVIGTGPVPKAPFLERLASIVLRLKGLVDELERFVGAWSTGPAGRVCDRHALLDGMHNKFVNHGLAPGAVEATRSLVADFKAAVHGLERLDAARYTPLAIEFTRRVLDTPALQTHVALFYFLTSGVLPRPFPTLDFSRGRPVRIPLTDAAAAFNAAAKALAFEDRVCNAMVDMTRVFRDLHADIVRHVTAEAVATFLSARVMEPSEPDMPATFLLPRGSRVLKGVARRNVARLSSHRPVSYFALDPGVAYGYTLFRDRQDTLISTQADFIEHSLGFIGEFWTQREVRLLDLTSPRSIRFLLAVAEGSPRVAAQIAEAFPIDPTTGAVGRYSVFSMDYAISAWILDAVPDLGGTSYVRRGSKFHPEIVLFHAGSVLSRPDVAHTAKFVEQAAVLPDNPAAILYWAQG